MPLLWLDRTGELDPVADARGHAHAHDDRHDDYPGETGEQKDHESSSIVDNSSLTVSAYLESFVGYLHRGLRPIWPRSEPDYARMRGARNRIDRVRGAL